MINIYILYIYIYIYFYIDIVSSAESYHQAGSSAIRRSQLLHCCEVEGRYSVTPDTCVVEGHLKVITSCKKTKT